MKRDREIEDQVEAYLSGRMNIDERKVFEALLLENKVLRETVRNEQLIKLNVKKYHNSKIKKQLQQIHHETINRKNIIRRLLIIAILVSIALGAYYFFPRKITVSNQELYAQYYSKYQIETLQRGNDDAILKDVFDLYEDNSFDKLVNRTEANALNNIPVSYRLILGISYLELEELEKAKLVFQNIIDNKDVVFYDQALWYKALAELKSDDKEKAKIILIEIVNDQTSDHYEEAKNLLESLD